MIPIPEIVAKHSLGPSVNIEDLIRELGIELDKKAELPEEISGLIERNSAGNFRIAVNSKEWYFRQRFTMAHELGHFLLHRSILQDGTADSVAYRAVPTNGIYNSHIGPAQEAQANAFAAEILMPLHLVKGAMEKANGNKKEAAVILKTSEPALQIRLDALKNSRQYEYIGNSQG